MNRLMYLIFIISLNYQGLAIADGNDSSELVPVDFETLEKGSLHGANTSKYQSVIEFHTAEELSASWEKFRIDGLSISEAPPILDFSSWFVIAVFNKCKPSPCYRFRVNNVYLTKGSPDRGASVSLEYVLLGAGYGCLAYVPKHFEFIKVKRL